MGDAEFDNSNTIAADSIDLDLAMGNFTGSTVQAEQFTANISMGDFDFGAAGGALKPLKSKLPWAILA